VLFRSVQYNEMKPMSDTAWAFVRGFGWAAWWKNRREGRNVYADYPGIFLTINGEGQL
jgi:hypothetical protein